MTTRRYKPVVNRHQPQMFPPLLEDYVADTNPVRAIDAYVAHLDLSALGFKYANGGVKAGQPAYDPSSLLKLYFYGYLNRIRGSRPLERETHRNIELIWLLEGLKPSYKTISDFRKNNADALKQLSKDFVLLCKELSLFGRELVCIDGSFFKGNTSAKSIKTKTQLTEELTKIEQDIEDYMNTCEQRDHSDETQEISGLIEDQALSEKLERLKKKQLQKQSQLNRLAETQSTQLSQTDEDAKLLYKRGKATPGYNVQSVVDDKHKLLLCYEVTNARNDQQQLLPQAQRAKKELGAEKLKVVADTGYYNTLQIKQCVDDEITPYVSISKAGKPKEGSSRFGKAQFHYDKQANCYRCPGDEQLEVMGRPIDKNGRRFIRYASKGSVCSKCEYKTCCLGAKSLYRTIDRWEHEEVIETHQDRMQGSGDLMRQRSAIVEHPFGTIKRRCGSDHFLLRGLNKVTGEMGLLVTTYNFTRVLNIIGLEKFIAHCKQRNSSIEPMLS